MHQIQQNAHPMSIRRAARSKIAIAPLVDQRARSLDDRAARRSTSALVGRAPLVDRATRWSTSDAIVRRACSLIDERRARLLIAIVDRAARSTIAIVPRAARWCGAIVRRAAWSSIVSLVGAARRDLGSLSLIWALSSLSLFLSLFPEVIWSENEGRKWFPGQRWKYWSIGSHFLENDIFRDSQTLRFYGKWFPETVFTQFKHTLKHYFQTNYNNLSGLFIVEMVHGHLFK